MQYLEECIQSHQPYDQNTFNMRSFTAESEWTHSKYKFPTKPVGKRILQLQNDSAGLNLGKRTENDMYESKNSY